MVYALGMIPTLVFDIETIPDTTGLRALLDLPADVSSAATDEEVANIAFHQRRQHNGSDFLPLQQHKVCAISCALRDPLRALGVVDPVPFALLHIDRNA